MSSKKRTVFAPVQQSANTTSGKNPSITRIDRRYLDSLSKAQVSRDLSTVMTKTNSQLEIKIQANGKGEYALKTSAGAFVADAQDIWKIQALGSIINEERKALLKEAVTLEVKKWFAALIAYTESISQTQITVVTRAFIDVFRGVKSQANILQTNMEAIDVHPATGPANDAVRTHMRLTVSRARRAIASFLRYRLTLREGERRRKLNDFLTEQGAMTWVFTKLSSQRLQLSKDFEYRKFYYPKDITKGLSILWREYRSESFIEKQPLVLTGLERFRPLFSDVLVGSLCDIPKDWDLDDFSEDVPSKVLANIPILVPGFAGSVKPFDILNTLSHGEDGGLPWSVGNKTNPQGILRFLGTVPKRTCNAAINSISMAYPLGKMFPGFQFKARRSEERGHYVQLAAWGKENEDLLRWFSETVIYTPPRDEVSGEVDVVRFNRYNERLLAVLHQILGIQQDDGEGLSAALTAAFKIPLSNIAWKKTAERDDILSGLYNDVRRMSDERADKILGDKVEGGLAPKKKKNTAEGALRSARTRLSSNALKVCQQLKRRGYEALSSQMTGWFRSFLCETTQSAVAEILAARLDAFPHLPVENNAKYLGTAYDTLDFNEKNEDIDSSGGEDE